MTTKQLTRIAVAIAGLGLATACTDLATHEHDSLVVQTTSGGGTNSSAVDLLQGSYNDLGTFTDQAGIYSMTEHTSDELIPPTRGVDWSDNGVWRSLYTHTWDPSHSWIQSAWNGLNQNAYRTQLILDASDATAQQKAEAKFLRAFNRWYIIDFWGQLPDRKTTDPPAQSPTVHNRSDAFDMVVQDINDALPSLSTSGPFNVGGAPNPTATRAAANIMLARLLLNKAVYKSATGVGPYTFDAGDMTNCIAACDAVTADGYSLNASYFDNFAAAGTSEVILTSQQGTPQNRVYMTLHYNQNPAGWNGFATLSDFYNKFEATDSRIGAPSPVGSGTPFHGITLGFLKGQQYNDSDAPITDTRTSIPLSFTADVLLSGAPTGTGIRVIKYHPATYGKYILLRYADVVLMRAEATLRGGTSAVTALDQINALRTLRGASTLGSVAIGDILDERGRELYWEGIRRTDLIRFEKFNDPWSQKGDNVDAFRVLFTIPQQALDSNPNLKQNPGY